MLKAIQKPLETHGNVDPSSSKQKPEAMEFDSGKFRFQFVSSILFMVSLTCICLGMLDLFDRST